MLRAMERADLLHLKYGREAIARMRAEVRAALLAGSPRPLGPDLEGLTAADLRLLFSLYDRLFFSGHFGAALEGRIWFGLSERLRSSAGMTRFYPAQGLFKVTMGIALFREAFRRGEREVEVNGLTARDRLDAFLLVFEHEFLHVAEWRLFGDSSCGGRRFRALAWNWFGHAGTTHTLPVAGRAPRRPLPRA